VWPPGSPSQRRSIKAAPRTSFQPQRPILIGERPNSAHGLAALQFSPIFPACENRPSNPAFRPPPKQVPSGPDWLHEIKHDGYRLIVQREGKRVRLFTRNGHDWTGRYPLISPRPRSATKARSSMGRCCLVWMAAPNRGTFRKEMKHESNSAQRDALALDC